MRFRDTEHLAALVADADAAAARIAAADPQRRAELAASARRTVARLSARLDGSPLEDATADRVDADERAGLPPTSVADRAPALDSTATVTSDGASGTPGWARVLRIDSMPTQDVAAVEYANLLAAVDAEPALAPRFLQEPGAVLVTLHGLVCRGLVDPAIIGRPRRSELAVHDGAQGRVLYNTPPPGAVGDLLAGLVAWLAGDLPAGFARPAAETPALLLAGVVHERLLQWQPFAAGNGRVARAAALLELRARGLDPDGVAVPEAAFIADRVAYYGEVAATIRRRDDLTAWLERCAEATVEALEAAADALGPRPEPDAPASAVRTVSALAPGDTITVADLAAAAEVSRADAQRHLRALVRAGLLARDPGTRGLRYRRR